MTTNILVIILTGIIILFAGKRFAESSSKIGDYLHVPRSVKGATLDAISSSFPELMIAFFSVISFHKFEVGIGTITGSALFNLLIIPGISVLVAPKAFKVSKNVVSRDGLFYVFSIIALLAVMLYSKTWTLAIPIILLLLYAVYISIMVVHTKEHRRIVKQKMETLKIKFLKEISIALFTMVLIAIAAFYLTGHSIALAEVLGVAPIIIAFTVIAITSSFPDAIISIVNAKKGDIDDAASNAFGSNVFDILVGLSLPALIAICFFGPLTIAFDHIEIIIGLLLSTLFVLALLGKKRIFTKLDAWLMITLYVGFVGYVVWLSL